MDAAAWGEGLAAPGLDPRTWCSYGVVSGSSDPDSEERCVDFTEGYPLVSVLTQPGLVPLRCKVAMRMAGNGEAEWHPFLPGDEVFIAIPEGDHRAGGVILGKLNNAIDRFPVGSVAGQDPTRNNFAFRRTRTPVVEENAGPVLLRSALTGGTLSIDETGAATLRSGNVGDPTAPAAAMRIAQDVMGWQSADATMLLQLATTDETFTMRLKDTVLTLSSGSSAVNLNQLITPGVLQVSASGQPPAEHVCTTEAAFSILINSLTLLLAPLNLVFAPITGTALATIIQTMLTTALPLAIPGIATAGITPAVASGIATAFTAALPKPPVVPGVAQTSPGIGCVGFLTG